MFKKDLIQRQFEEFGLVLSKLLRLKKELRWNEFEAELEQALQSLAESNIPAIEPMTDEDFEIHVIHTKTLNFDKKKLMARLLFEKMLSYQERGQVDQYLALKTKCAKLYHYLNSQMTEHEFDLEIHYRQHLLKSTNE